MSIKSNTSHIVILLNNEVSCICANHQIDELHELACDDLKRAIDDGETSGSLPCAFYDAIGNKQLDMIDWQIINWKSIAADLNNAIVALILTEQPERKAGKKGAIIQADQASTNFYKVFTK